MISFKIEDENNELQDISIPEDISLSLMEVMKASEIPVMATCGGMALCATCHVEIIEGAENLASPEDMELDMLDTLPDPATDSRLACQIRISPALEGAVIKFRGNE